MKKKTEIVIKIQSKNLRSKECLNRERKQPEDFGLLHSFFRQSEGDLGCSLLVIFFPLFSW